MILSSQGSSQALQELHACHSGCSFMNAISRMFCWWPGRNGEMVHKYVACQPGLPPSPLQPWQWPTKPQSQLHLDYVGLFMGLFVGHMFMVPIYAHSKWRCKLLHQVPPISS